MSHSHPITHNSPLDVMQISGTARTNPKAKAKAKANNDIHIRHAKELARFKKVLIDEATQNAVEGLYIIDMIQRLGIEHHFQHEIESLIQKQQHLIHHLPNLSQVAIQFRLLRQQGCYVHADVFNKFKDKEGRLKQIFWGNVEGLIELFEASHLSLEGENDLEQARDLTHNLLSSWQSTLLDMDEPNFIADTLKYPTHTSLSRFTPRSFLFPISQLNKPWFEPLQNLSKIDTQIINSINLKEIYAVSKWWKDLGLAKDLKFARDEPIKWYMWAMACFSDPCLSDERIELTKPISLVYIIDDIFDVYGSIDELTLFVDAILRWDLTAIEQLPDYMKACFKALHDITDEFSNKVQNKHGLNPKKSLIRSWVRLFDAFMEEAKWFASGEVPGAEEYLKNGIVSTGVQVALVHGFFLLGQGISKQNMALIDNFPRLISSTATILRLCDDLEGAKEHDNNDDQDGTGKDGSYLKCYMKEHPGICIEEARQHMRHKISQAWRILNKECLNPTNSLPLSFTKFCLNAARMVPLMYSYDSYSPSRLQHYVRSLLHDHPAIQISP